MYAAYRLFDLDTWAVLRRSPESGVASTLTCAGQKMCGALGVVFDEDNWKRAACEALSVQEQMLRRPADKRVDNRAAWIAVIEKSKVSEAVVSVVLFYLSNSSKHSTAQPQLQQPQYNRHTHTTHTTTSQQSNHNHTNLCNKHTHTTITTATTRKQPAHTMQQPQQPLPCQAQVSQAQDWCRTDLLGK